MQVLLSGEHPSLPRAELVALGDVHGFVVKGAGRIVGIDGDSRALDQAALVHEWIEPWHEDDDSPEGHARLAKAAAAMTDGEGSIAVRALRVGHDKSIHAPSIERTIGTAMVAAGHTVDLSRPDQIVRVWLVDGRATVGRLVGTPKRGRFDARRGEHRAHFSPVTLHPRRAMGLLHLARAPPGGRIHDPFCGTGTFVLEALIGGYAASGSDLDATMVQGTMQALTDDAQEPLDADVFQADIADVPELLGTVDAVVSDLPYGRASGTRKEPVDALYARAFAAMHTMLPPDGHAVLGAAKPLDAPGFTVVERHEEHVHRSLTRHYTVLRRA